MFNLQSIAQFLQDAFVYSVIEEKNNGFFVDIGAGIGGPEQRFYHPLAMSNTFVLEKLGWSGIAIDYDIRWFDAVQDVRTCQLSCENLLDKNINDVLQDLNCPEKCTYLSLDVDDAQEKVFEDFDFEKYKFDVITYETNLYFGDHMKEPTEKSREKFKSLNYKLLFGGVGENDEKPVEDWYVNEEIFKKYKHLYCDGISARKAIQSIRNIR
jgi:hypothetical protein